LILSAVSQRTGTGVLALVSEHYLLTWLEQGGTSWRIFGLTIYPKIWGSGSAPKKFCSDCPLRVAVPLIADIFIAFGRMSQGCERQADIYGCRAGHAAGKLYWA
jgi:hypothetical protein